MISEKANLGKGLLVPPVVRRSTIHDQKWTVAEKLCSEQVKLKKFFFAEVKCNEDDVRACF